jgi:glutamyl-tRNA reductase
MTKKQIVTFELKLGHTPVELLVRLAPDQEKIISILNTYKHKFDEMVIINTDRQLIFYIYTDDYSPLVELFSAHDIATKYFRMLVNSKESIEHFYELIGGVQSTIKEEKKVLKYLKESYEMAKSVGSIGKVLEPLMATGLITYRQVHKESVLGKISMTLVSKSLDMFSSFFEKEKLTTATSSHEINKATVIENT